MDIGDSKEIIVLGMHRSGTSLVASFVELAGVSMGEQLVGSSVSNMDGHFEDLELIAINDGLLKSMGCSWDKPPSYTDVTLLKDEEGLPYKDYSAKRARVSSVWGVKDPRLSISMPLLHPYLSNPYFVVCSRDAEDVALSLNKRDGISISEGKLIKEKYDSFIDDFFRENPGQRVLKLNYEALMSTPEELVRSLYDFLDFSYCDQDIKLACAKVRGESALMLAKRDLMRAEMNEQLKKLASNPLRLLAYPFWIMLFRLYSQYRKLV